MTREPNTDEVSIDSFYRLFNDELLKDEKVLWVGKPNPSIVFNRNDTFMIPFSFIWCSTIVLLFAVFNATNVHFIAYIWAVPMLILGLYALVGRFVDKYFLKKRTWYTITNQRVMILLQFTSIKVQSLFIENISAISKSIRKNGNGAIRFGNAPYHGAIYPSSGIELFLIFFLNVLTFYDIDDAQRVYDLANELQEKQKEIGS